MLATHAGKTHHLNKIIRIILSFVLAHILRLVDQVLLMSDGGMIIDAGTYEQLAVRHPTIFKHQNPAPKPSSEGETQIEGRAEFGEFQTKLHTELEGLRRQRGDWRSYVFYFRSMGWFNFFLFVIGSCLCAAFTGIYQVWLTWWAEDTTGSHNLGYWLGLYVAWAVFTALAILITPL